MPVVEATVGKQSFKKHLEQVFSAVKPDRESFDYQWKLIGSHISPRRSRWEVTDVNRGDRRWNKIINSIATDAVRVATAGMFAGTMSPARPWMALVTPNQELMERHAVRVWLHVVEQMILAVFRDSNFYDVAPIIIKELLLYGTSLMTHVDNFENVARFYSHPVGSYWLGQDEDLMVNRFVREVQMKVDQVVGKFGYDNCSPDVKRSYDRGDYLKNVVVVHHVLPNNIPDRTKPFARSKPTLGVYYERGTMDRRSSKDMFLAVEGFFEPPFYAPRWETTGMDVYAAECPGIVALGDVKQLQTQERRKAQAIDKQVSPPLQGPPGLNNVEVNSLPGGVTVFDTGTDSKGLRPIYEVQLSVQELRQDMNKVEQRIRNAFFVPLFLAISEMEGVQPRNQLEIMQRNDEKLLQLGPVLQRIHGEFLTGAVQRVFNQLLRAGVLPEPPAILQKQPLEVTYISSLAQAQRAVATQGIDRVLTFALTMFEAKPDIMDKIDSDFAVEEYARLVGTSPKLIKSNDDVAAIRQGRAEAQENQRALEQIQAGANAMKLASDAKVEENNILGRMTGEGG